LIGTYLKKDFFFVLQEWDASPYASAAEVLQGRRSAPRLNLEPPIINFNLLSCVRVKSVHFSASIDPSGVKWWIYGS
jgi:hypothetical protein